MKTEIKLCCKRKGCPVLKKVNEQVVKITDDYGNTVTLTTDEAKLLPDALKDLLII
tara:strand:+ start:105 stop:272 length:168 start_codon:yes stop_codon:yes gene_type:complete